MERSSKSPTLRITLAVLPLVALLMTSQAFSFEYRESLEGHPVRWRAPQVHVVLDESLSELGDMEVVEYLVIDAFDEWTAAADLPIEFSFTRGTCWGGYENDGLNENCIYTQAGPDQSDEDSGATTFLTYGNNTGAIRDSDIVIYSEAADWSLEDGDGGDFSLREALIHEVGHFFGLEHTDIVEARMYPYMSSMEAVDHITLHDDDRQGVLALYQGLDPAIDGPASCSVVSPGGSQTNPFIFLILATLIVGILRRPGRTSTLSYSRQFLGKEQL